MSLRFLLAFALLLAASAAASARADKPVDHYVLSLSWSPTWCATAAGAGDALQCGPGRRYAFVVHGLWPQYDRGWPENCDSAERWVGDATISGMLDIMPSKRLVIHEWRKHGTCSGLAQEAYFALTRKLRATIRIPARYLGPVDPVVITPGQLITDFVKTNPGLERDMLSVHCGNRRDTGRLRELRICYSTDGHWRPCGHMEGYRCRARELVLPPVR